MNPINRYEVVMRIISLKISRTFRNTLFNGLTFTKNNNIPKLDNCIYDICNKGDELMKTITIAKNSLLNRKNKVSNIDELIDVSMFKYRLLKRS